MKTFLFLALSCFLFFSCSKKTIPAKTNNVQIVPGNNNVSNNNPNINPVTEPANNNGVDSIATDSATAVNNTAAAFMVITNGYGKIITQKDSLPADANVDFNQFQLSKGFSAQQLRNLKARYSTIPPRVLYVNPQMEQQSARGTFYVLGKKFWYWKKQDGLFYLDEKYYL